MNGAPDSSQQPMDLRRKPAEVVQTQVLATLGDGLVPALLAYPVLPATRSKARRALLEVGRAAAQYAGLHQYAGSKRHPQSLALA